MISPTRLLKPAARSLITAIPLTSPVESEIYKAHFRYGLDNEVSFMPMDNVKSDYCVRMI